MITHKATQRNIRNYFILCGLLGMAGTLQAATPVQSSDTMGSYPREAHQQRPHKRAVAPSLPPNQLLIPANGQCLYTAVIMGYLLPVREAPDELTTRTDQLFGLQPAYYLNELHQILQNPTHYLTFLHSDTFSTLVTDFMAVCRLKKALGAVQKR